MKCYDEKNRKVKKIELHLHLDGSVRIDTESNITLNDECLKLYNSFNFSIEDFKKINMNAIEWVFISEEEKQEVKTLLD